MTLHNTQCWVEGCPTPHDVVHRWLVTGSHIAGVWVGSTSYGGDQFQVSLCTATHKAYAVQVWGADDVIDLGLATAHTWDTVGTYFEPRATDPMTPIGVGRCWYRTDLDEPFIMTVNGVKRFTVHP